MMTALTTRTLRNEKGMGIIAILSIIAGVIPAVLALSVMFRSSFRLQKMVHDDETQALITGELLTQLNARELCTTAINAIYVNPSVASSTFNGSPVPFPIQFKLPNGTVFGNGYTKYSLQVQSLTLDSMDPMGASAAYGAPVNLFQSTLSIRYQRTGNASDILGSPTQSDSYTMYFMADAGTSQFLGCFSKFTPDAQCINANGMLDWTKSPPCVLKSLLVSRTAEIYQNMPMNGPLLMGTLKPQTSLEVAGDIIKTEGPLQAKACAADGSSCPNFYPWYTSCEDIIATGPNVTYLGPGGNYDDSVSASCPSGKIAVGYAYSVGDSKVFIDGASVRNQTGTGQVRIDYGTIVPSGSAIAAGATVTAHCCSTRFIPRQLDPGSILIVDWTP